MVSRERLLELFQYDDETGNHVRKIGRSGPKARAGDVAGRVTDIGYFSSIDEAKEAYINAARKYHGEYARAS